MVTCHVEVFPARPDSGVGIPACLSVRSTLQPGMSSPAPPHQPGVTDTAETGLSTLRNDMLDRLWQCVKLPLRTLCRVIARRCLAHRRLFSRRVTTSNRCDVRRRQLKLVSCIRDESQCV